MREVEDGTRLGIAALTYLALLPAATFATVSFRGATVSGSDALLAGLVLVGAATAALRLGRRGGGGWAARIQTASGVPPEDRTEDGEPAGGGAGSPHRIFSYAVVLLWVFGVWVALGSAWSFHQDYALVKGAGYGALAAGVACVGFSRVGWWRAMDAWLVGAGLALLLTLGALVSGSEVLVERVVYRFGAVRGLPLPRLRGPFPHPNGFGDYLMVSGALLWARWPAWTAPGAPGWARAGAAMLAACLGLALLLTVSSAWIGAGVLLVGLGRWIGAPPDAPGSFGRARLASLGARLSGAALVGVTLAGLVSSVRFDLPGLTVTSGGIRPRIWRSALQAFLEAPLGGVGAAPVLAVAADPLDPNATPSLWDAHNGYLSVLGQFGLVGALLLGGGVWLVARHLQRAELHGGGGDGEEPRARARMAVAAILAAVAVHAFFIAGEDLRHWWAVLGVAGIVGITKGRAGPGGPWDEEDPRRGATTAS